MRGAIITGFAVGFATALANGVVSGVLVGAIVMLAYASGRQDGRAVR